MSNTHLPYRLLVFDWDGTVMDSLASIIECTLAGLRDLGFEAPPVSEIRAAIGLSHQESLDRLFPGYGPEDRARITERNRHHWLSTYRHRSTLIDGAGSVIRNLAEGGYFLAVATGKARAGLDLDFETTGLGEHFLATRTVDDAASKPHPEMLLSLLDELGTRPTETLMIGDSTIDLEMARNAGCDGLGVLTGSHGREVLEACDPRGVIESVGVLPAWLESRSAVLPKQASPGQT